MKKSRESDGKRIKRLLALHQLLRSGKQFSTEALQEAYAEKTGESLEKKTLQNDLRFMRLELFAPLPEKANKHTGYFYNGSFSILEALDDSYFGSLNEALALLRQMAKSKEFIGLEDILLRLEQRVSATDAEKNSFIQFQEQALKGKERLGSLHQFILKKQFLQIDYHPFNTDGYIRHVYPLLLKEYNNRWFLIAWEKDKHTPQNLAIDRIEGVRETYEDFVFNRQFDVNKLFENLIGVTPEGTFGAVKLRFSPGRFPFVQTKKMHSSQQEVAEHTIEIQVYTNRELRAKILEFGADVEVIEPKILRDEITEILQKAAGNYATGSDVQT